MTHVPLEDLTEKVDSKYRLVIIAAERSRQLNQNAPPLVQPRGHKPTYLALEEIAAGKIEYSVKPVEEVTKTGVYAEAVKPTWFREIAPEGVTAEEVLEAEEHEQELEVVVPVEAEEGTEEEGEEEHGEEEAQAEEVEGEIVGLDQLEKGNNNEEE
ncbi:MAG: DNA-directed RNA polymerase subunit omega [Candidatus Methylomirabilales bacterium]